MELGGFFTLKQAVTDVLIDKFGTVDDARYWQLMRWAQRQMVKMKIHILPQNKPVKLPVIMNPYSVKLPGDYVNFRAIGIDNNGEFVPFDKMQSMATYIGEACGQEEQGTQEIASTTPTHGHQQWYKYYLDEQNQRILLQGYPYLDEVILLYVSTGVEIGGDTLIPAKVYEVMVAWLHYQLAVHGGEANLGQVEMAFKAYEREVALYQKTKININDLYAITFDVVNNKQFPL